MGTVTLSTVLWDANDKTEENSRCFTDVWAHRFFNGWRRHITLPTRCVLFTDRRRDLPSWIEQIIQPDLGSNGYGDCVRPFQLNEPMIFAGLDTIVVGHCDKFARYCLEAKMMALPKHPYEAVSINGVVFCPAGQRRIFDEWRGENDMKWMRRWPHQQMDTLWPGRIVSYKARVRGRGQGNASIIYFHGKPKMHQALGDPIVKAAWR